MADETEGVAQEGANMYGTLLGFPLDCPHEEEVGVENGPSSDDEMMVALEQLGRNLAVTVVSEVWPNFAKGRLTDPQYS